MTTENAYQIPFPELSEEVPIKEKEGSPPPRGFLPLRDTPAYRAAYRPDACSTAELLAAVLRGPDPLPSAYRVMDTFRGLRALSQAAPTEITSLPGIGPAKAASLKAALELARRLSAPEAETIAISNPEDAANLLIPRLGHLEQEHLVVLPLNTRNRLIGEPVEVYHGSLNTSAIRVGEVLRPALQANAAAIIVAHNHPSSDPTPSPEDVAVTRAIVEAGRILDIDVLDHLIIGGNRFISLKAKGLGFS